MLVWPENRRNEAFEIVCECPSISYFSFSSASILVVFFVFISIKMEKGMWWKNAFFQRIPKQNSKKITVNSFNVFCNFLAHFCNSLLYDFVFHVLISPLDTTQYLFVNLLNYRLNMPVCISTLYSYTGHWEKTKILHLQNDMKPKG